MQKNELDSVKNGFIKYLNSLGISLKSHKNYRSDLNNFLSWAFAKIRTYGSFADSALDIVPFLSPSLATEYKSRLVSNGTPKRTVNRRLSTLRHLSKFMIESGTTDIDFMENVENVSLGRLKRRKTDPVLLSFKSHLEAEKVSANTIKNYLNDIKQFMFWLEQKN